ncbi:hypothetical protein TPHA_0P00870 [Tetrapisispora phaffii CBS 4417]|uniref:Uncharacterized protein n=1 Tax=Tetrapisispora phaffii (strain ATCC 24235 / CBS 4417 / NBRC 1672 / NRRL Y-8282 / UCD 70-5) TaxID=1071381 RepID=G8C267_TETPH|nr:hypothetical protein TPHA_0P00870 [Tetrapisispora phaffii CBS 4417]CCE66245.1 hypothetical protein TPHA_0P00870 [Tetrapisispora phaffii CBS 4417]
MFGIIRRHISIGRSGFFARDHRLLLVPLSEQDVFFHYEYPHRLVNMDRRVVKLDRWMTRKAHGVWDRFGKSENRVNRYLYGQVSKFVENVPWEEESLRRFPIETHLHGVETVAMYGPYQVGDEMQEVTATLNKKLAVLEPQYKRQIALCVAAMPLTIPIMLIPLVPNIPSFILCYRVYCHYRSLHGLKMFKSILNDKARHTYMQLTDFPAMPCRGAGRGADGMRRYSKRVAEYAGLPSLATALLKADQQRHVTDT